MKKSLVTTLGAAAIASISLLSGSAFATTFDIGVLNPPSGAEAYSSGSLGSADNRNFVNFTLAVQDFISLAAIDTAAGANLAGEALVLIKTAGAGAGTSYADGFVKAGVWVASLGAAGSGLLLGPGTYQFNIDPVGTDHSQVGYSLSVTGVPEAATWAMMLSGFAAIGFAGYRRKAVSFGA
jgi:hypothetical protein